MNRTPLRRRSLLLAPFTVLGLVVASVAVLPASAEPGVGNDISWPQCGRAFPTGAAFGIVGVTGGKPYTENPCMAQQAAWADATGVPPGFYINTANPGPETNTNEWYGRRTPNASCSRANESACAYNYGYEAAQRAFAYATSRVSAGSGHTWWLDVETTNSWSRTDLGANLADIAGALDFLTAQRVAVGVYSTPLQWGRITGGARIPNLPNWAAGARDASQAAAFCSTKSFTGAPVLLAQYVAGGFDHDYACPGADAILHPPAVAPAGPLDGLTKILNDVLKGLGIPTG